jgi:diaminopimelate decarboxylase
MLNEEERNGECEFVGANLVFALPNANTHRTSLNRKSPPKADAPLAHKIVNRKSHVPVDQFFHYKNNQLYCESVSLTALAKKFGTPLFVTSKNSMLTQYRRFEKAFAPLKHLTCYSVKANFNLEVIRTLQKAGSGFDVNSGGELYRTLKAGASPKTIIMAGVGKTREDIEYALRSKILMLKAESFSELRAINEVAKKLKVKAPVGLRINPNVMAETHPYITTGDDGRKFGIDESLAAEAFTFVRSLKHIAINGLEMHIGSQIFSIDSYYEATLKLLGVKSIAESMGFHIAHLDIGGGYPITYQSEKQATSIESLAAKLIPVLKNQSAQILFEPGRFIVGNASVIVTELLYHKKNHRGKNFLILDAAMTELIRPTLYEAHHDILPVKKTAKTIVADVVGGVCETGDYFALDRKVAAIQEGELLSIMSAGAYGTVMSSHYNARLKAAEVMINGTKIKLTRKRETLPDLIRNEI